MGTVPLPQGDNHVQTWDGVTAGKKSMQNISFMFYQLGAWGEVKKVFIPWKLLVLNSLMYIVCYGVRIFLILILVIDEIFRFLKMSSNLGSLLKLIEF